METPGSQFLHERDPQLHASEEVEGVVDYLNQNGEHIPNEPADKISAYLGFLANKNYVNDGILTGDQTSIDRQIDAHVIKTENVPEGYFELQRRIAREQGHGDVQITAEMRRQMIEAVQADQRVGLGKWVEYLGGEDGGYPDWFKHYTFSSVTKLGNYDKEKGEFLKRSRGTTAAYPELNREALAYVYDVLNKSRVRGETVDGGANNEQLQRLLKTANFGKLYAHAVMEIAPTSKELLQDTRGSWTKFAQSEDPRTARRLSGSLQGHGTGWCTAGESTANIQLQGGDFYVYYTRDEDGKDTVPRVAIRMQDGQVAEVRGINHAQELEPEMADITSERLQDLPGGEEYIRKAEDMKRLTALDKRITVDPSAELSREDVKFLYELDHSIEGFGYEADPRVQEIRNKRGKLDHAELKVLAVEHLRESFEASYGGYSAIASQVQMLARPETAKRGIFGRGRQETKPAGVLSHEAVQELFTAKLAEWQQSGVLDYVAERIISHGELHTPVARPNVIVPVSGLKALANDFAKGQNYDKAYIYDQLYDQYTTDEELAQLSGYNPAEGVVSFSLIPNKRTEELGIYTAEEQVRILANLRDQSPKLNLKVPSLLDAMTLWQTLRASGDKLADRTTWNKTYIRHFNLAAKRLGGFLYVPYSAVYDDGKPYLRRSFAEHDDLARLSVG